MWSKYSKISSFIIYFTSYIVQRSLIFANLSVENVDQQLVVLWPWYARMITSSLKLWNFADLKQNIHILVKTGTYKLISYLFHPLYTSNSICEFEHWKCWLGKWQSHYMVMRPRCDVMHWQPKEKLPDASASFILFMEALKDENRLCALWCAVSFDHILWVLIVNFRVIDLNLKKLWILNLMYVGNLYIKLFETLYSLLIIYL